MFNSDLTSGSVSLFLRVGDYGFSLLIVILRKWHNGIKSKLDVSNAFSLFLIFIIFCAKYFPENSNQITGNCLDNYAQYILDNVTCHTKVLNKYQIKLMLGCGCYTSTIINNYSGNKTWRHQFWAHIACGSMAIERKIRMFLTFFRDKLNFLIKWTIKGVKGILNIHNLTA